MAKSNRRKKDDRAKAAAFRRAEQERRRAKAARQRQSAEHYEQLNDPSASPADIAEVLAAEFPGQVIAADMLRLRMSLGVPVEEVTETARLLLERAAPEPPGTGALAVAALAAHLAGDEDAEHDYGSGWRGSSVSSSTRPPSPRSAAGGRLTPPGSAPSSVSNNRRSAGPVTAATRRYGNKNLSITTGGGSPMCRQRRN